MMNNINKKRYLFKSVLAVLLAMILSFSSTVFYATAAESQPTDSGKIKITVKAIDATKSITAKDPLFRGQLRSGKLLTGDTMLNLGLVYTRTPGTTAGRYQINVSLPSTHPNSEKYEVVGIPGTLTINGVASR